MIRHMRPEDADQVYRIICESLDQYYAPEIASFFLAQWPKGQLVFCDAAGKIHGFLSGALLVKNITAVSMFAVEKEYRNRGIGTQLLNAFRRESAMRGCMLIQLEVREENGGAIRFYERNGFTKTELLLAFYDDDGNAVRMISSPYVNS